MTAHYLSPLDLRGAARQRHARARRCRRRQPAARADGQGARRLRRGHDLVGGEEELARGAGADGRSATTRSATGARAGRRARDLRRDRRDDLRGMDALRARGIMVLYGMASGPAPVVRPAGAAGKSLYLTRPGLPATRPRARSCRHARATCWAGSRTARSTCASASATRSRTRGAPTRPRGAALDRKLSSSPEVYQAAASALLSGA